MAALDRQFWLEALASVHPLTADGGVRCNWAEWAKAILRKVQGQLDKVLPSRGPRIPLESTTGPGDAQQLRAVLRKLGLPDGTSETDALHRLYHLLDDGTLEISDSFNEAALFLLYRLIEGFGPVQAKDWIAAQAELTSPGAITPRDLGKRVRLAHWPTEEWVTVHKILSGKEYEQCYSDLSIDCVGPGCFANNSEYFLAKTEDGTSHVWGCNDEWERMDDRSC